MQFIQKNLMLITALLVVAGVVAYKMLSSNDAMFIPPSSTTTVQDRSNQNDLTSTAQNETNPSGAGLDSTSSSQTSSETGAIAAPVLSRTERIALESKAHFLSVAGLEADLPQLPFVNLDLPEENFTAIYATTPGMDMALIAAKVSPTEKDILAFINSKDTGIPNLDRSQLEVSGPISAEPIPGNGMGKGLLWTGKLATGDDVRVAVMPRADGNGTYMVVVSGPQGSIDQNEEFYDHLYEKFKAVPLQK